MLGVKKILADTLGDKLRLGVNIDHVATIRNARGGDHPDPIQAAHIAMRAGADSIVAHLREDRRHISDDDIERLLQNVDLPLNLEMAATDEMLTIATNHAPRSACIVPERREERTTEGGLDVVAGQEYLGRFVSQLSGAGVRVSLFIEPDRMQMDAAIAVGAPVVELHTGAFCNAQGQRQIVLLEEIVNAAVYGTKIGLEIHAGHGLSLENVGSVAAIQEVVELNIGHHIVGEAIFSGFEDSIRRMRAAMNRARVGSHTNRSA